jgi:Holliday junction DNA helicase RuvB
MKEEDFEFSDLQKNGDEPFENKLRPSRLSDYIGQEKVKDSLSVFIQAAKLRKEPLEHVLIYGPPGLGKTTLAYVLAHETGTNIRITSGPAVERAGDLVSILTNLEDSDILFIDEIHRLNKVVEEVLYPAMEDYAVDVVIGRGPSAKTLRVDLPKFTLIGATTRVSLVSSPLRDRFGIVHSLDFYTEEEIGKILKRSSKILKVKLDDLSFKEIARRSRRTPRVANRLLKRVRDFATVYNKGVVDNQLALNSLERLGIDEKGLDETDRRYLKTLLEKFSGGPAGVETLAAATSIDKETIEEVIEPYLMQIGFIKRTPKGRVMTDLSREYFGVNHQERLIK